MIDPTNQSINHPRRLSLAENPVPLKESLLLALDLPETDWRPDYGSKEEVRAFVDSGWVDSIRA